MPEIGTSGLMSGDGKRGSRYRARPRLYKKTPDWAWDRAVELSNMEGGQWSVNGLKFWSSGRAFAKYVSENEPAPVSIDPDLLLAREVVHEIAVEHDWVGLDILSGERDKDDVYGIPQALAAIKAYKERNGL